MLPLFLPAAGFFVVYVCSIVGGIAWMRRRRKTKWPFKNSDKLLRGPGESLRKRILEFDDAFMLEFFGGIIVIAFGSGIVAIALKGIGLAEKTAFAVLVTAFAGATTISVWRITRLWGNRTNNFLGWYGERIVADKLRPLQFSGYRVFHDFPCETGKSGFNIDHVVVGPTGIAIVEVKARRKYDGPHGHELTFDGTNLIGPWGSYRKPINQTLNQADWLAKWIFEKVGLKVHVKPVLTFPGWHITESPGPVRVVPTDFLCDAVRGRGQIVLNSTQIDQISRWVDERCRDVED